MYIFLVTTLFKFSYNKENKLDNWSTEEVYHITSYLY